MSSTYTASSSPHHSAMTIRRRKALADALAGVVATLVSLWTFYPIDVWKTKVQAGKSVSNTTTTKRNLQVDDLFRGLPIKTLHAASSSFCYFYLFSFIVSWWTHHSPNSSTSGNNKKPTMSPAVRLALNAVAASLNTLLTLPLDVLASQHQTASSSTAKSWEATKTSSSSSPDETQYESSSDEEEHELNLTVMEEQQQQARMNQVWQQLEEEEEDAPGGDIFYDSCSEQQEDSPVKNSSRGEEEKEEQPLHVVDKPAANTSTCSIRKGRVTITVTTSSAATEITSNKTLGTKQTTSVCRTSTNSTISNSSQKQENPFGFISQLPKYWKGLYPSLLLCSNPSIHYTVYDMAKSHLLQAKSRSSSRLNMKEAFLLGLFAKFCATMATYPLIRAKVMLMVTSRTNMWKTLLAIYQQDGIADGWYKGCSLQLLHTVLKSALLMMVKERISTTTHRMLVPSTTPQSASQGK